VVFEARREEYVTSRCSARCSGFARRSASVAVVVLVIVGTGCGRPGAGGVDPAPTHIVQPTPDPTMVEVIRGNASPVLYLPPLQIAGSPTAVPAAARPAAPSAPSRPTPKPAAPAREPAPASKPAPANPAPRPAPTAVKPSNSNPANGTGAPGAAPAIINPNTLLPGGPARPNPTPSR